MNQIHLIRRKKILCENDKVYFKDMITMKNFLFYLKTVFFFCLLSLSRQKTQNIRESCERGGGGKKLPLSFNVCHNKL